MSWSSGYVSDIAYASGVYLETAPAHLSLCTTLAGVRAPDAGAPFRYLELGCGTGLGLCLMAAANPHGHFVGVDFNPAHVAFAQRLIEAAGLENVEVREASFADLAQDRPAPEDRFHYTVAHGVWTWVTRAVQEDIVRLLDAQVRPGGLVYLGYNNMAGWATSLTLRQLIFDHAARVPGDSFVKIRAAVAFALSLRAGAPRGVDFSRLEAATGKDETMLDRAPAGLFAYLAHEYLNESWRPVFPTEVEEALADAKLAFAASANPLVQMPELALTETEAEASQIYSDAQGRRRLADHLGPQPFRQDIFVRGLISLMPDAQAALLRGVTLMQALPSEAMSTQLSVPGGQLELDAAVYGPVYERLAKGPATVGELAALVADGGGAISAAELLTVLVGSSAASPAARPQAERSVEADRERSRRFNVAMMAALREQAGMRLGLASAKLGSGVRANIKDCLAYLTQAAPEDRSGPLNDPELRRHGVEHAPFWRGLDML